VRDAPNGKSALPDRIGKLKTLRLSLRGRNNPKQVVAPLIFAQGYVTKLESLSAILCPIFKY
jgi:hypothetical protein